MGGRVALSGSEERIETTIVETWQLPDYYGWNSFRATSMFAAFRKFIEFSSKR